MKSLFTLLFCTAIALAQIHCPSENLPVSSITFKGLEITKKLVVERELENKIHEPFSCAKWEHERKTLLSLSIFSGVELKTQSKGDSLQLNYEFKELPAFVVLPVFSLSDQGGVFLGAGMAGLNLWGLDLSSQLSWKTNVHPNWNTITEYYGLFSSRWMGTLPLEWLLYGGRTDSYNSLKNFSERSWRSELHLNYRLLSPWSLRLYGAHLQIEATRSQGFYNPEEGDFWIAGGGGLRFDTRDSEVQTMEGLFAEGEVVPHIYLNSQAQHLLYRLDLRYWKSWGNHTLHPSTLVRLRRGDVGFYDLYHAGGANSLRSFKADSNRYGQSEWVRTLEYRYLFFDESPFVIPLLDWTFFWGLQGVLGADWLSLYNAEGKETDYSGPYVGVHLLLPALKRLRLELGFDHLKMEFQFGLYEISETRNWRTR